MTLYEFNLLPYKRQLATVLDVGTYLAVRWEEENSVNLYHLPGGFFVEVYYAPHTNALGRMRSFSSTGPLEDYAAGIQLPDWT